MSRNINLKASGYFAQPEVLLWLHGLAEAHGLRGKAELAFGIGTRNAKGVLPVNTTGDPRFTDDMRATFRLRSGSIAYEVSGHLQGPWLNELVGSYLDRNMYRVGVVVCTEDQNIVLQRHSQEGWVEFTLEVEIKDP